MRRGHSLIEVIVVLAIFGSVTTIGASLFSHALSSTAAGERRQTALDECRGFVYRISEELREATEIVDPPWKTLAEQGSPYLVFRTRDGLVGYTLVPDSTAGATIRIVQRAVYPSTYSAGNPATQPVVAGSRRAITSAPSSLWFSIDPAGGLPPGQGGTETTPGTSNGLAWGTQKFTVKVRASVTPQDAPPVAMGTKKTLWAGIFAAQANEPPEQTASTTAP